MIPDRESEKCRRRPPGPLGHPRVASPGTTQQKPPGAPQQKRFQVTYGWAVSPAGMQRPRARNSGSPMASGSPLRLPAMGRSRTIRGARASRRLDAAFHSPAAAARFGATSAGSTFPACTFTALRSACQPVHFCVPQSRFRAIGPHKGWLPRTPYPRRFLASPLPFGTFRSRRIVARCDSPPESLPSPDARCPSLPATAGSLPPPWITGPDSLRPAWLASSVNLLEPPSSCTGSAVAVNTENGLVKAFSAAFFGRRISGLPESGVENRVDKTFRSGPAVGRFFGPPRPSAWPRLSAQVQRVHLGR